MQCPSCEFQNMPGLESCGRCGTSLGLRTAAIDVNPPRASRTAKRLRKVVPHGAIYQARDLAVRVRDGRRGLDRRRLAHSAARARDSLAADRSRLGSHPLGPRDPRAVFPGGVSSPALLGLVQWGTSSGSILLGLAFSVHASSVMDILIRQGTVRFPRMMATALFVSLVLAVLIYAPAGFVLTPDGGADRVCDTTPPFRGLTWCSSTTGPTP